ncbi:hypothetical protein MBAV_001263 [Candidatus Magnetobacterium bavaricum]|uniref:Uncharacterized protein n=1 Tax=Candidatus Magnetobacterium bavaricum TaxID=29290 RepID=A0A0F3GXF8_9BACT|nr:hypothetical protein MBAV_001263 [Candidatus Magnetobacterium bavaricum]
MLYQDKSGLQNSCHSRESRNDNCSLLVIRAMILLQIPFSWGINPQRSLRADSLSTSGMS